MPNALSSSHGGSSAEPSFHLGKLGNANLVGVVAQGRHRYFRLSCPDVAKTLETLLASHHLRAPKEITGSCPAGLRAARYCYDHLAGRLGVAIYRAMLSNAWVVPHGQHLIPIADAVPLLERLDIRDDRTTLEAKPCLDWSEREFHLAGALGRVLLRAMLDKRWLLRGRARAITLTEEGRRQLWALGISDGA